MLFVGRVLNAVLLPDQLAIEDDHRLLVFRIVSHNGPHWCRSMCFSGNLWLGFRCCAQTASETTMRIHARSCLVGSFKDDLGRRGSRAPVIASQNISTRCNVRIRQVFRKFFLRAAVVVPNWWAHLLGKTNEMCWLELCRAARIQQ